MNYKENGYKRWSLLSKTYSRVEQYLRELCLLENAKTFLDDYYMDIIYSVFTNEVIERYRLEKENK